VHTAAVLLHGSRLSAPAELLAHRDDVVIAAFVAHWEVTRAEAEALFEDLMAWLWAAGRPGAPALSIEPAMRIVDEMWHELMLHSRRYAALCERWFGRFVHHRPEPAPGAPDDEPGPGFDAVTAEAQWRYLGAELGVERLLRWYVELPLRHDDDWFRRARRVADTGYRPTPVMIDRWRERCSRARTDDGR
jgi:hypothetical protein